VVGENRTHDSAHNSRSLWPDPSQSLVSTIAVQERRLPYWPGGKASGTEITSFPLRWLLLACKMAPFLGPRDMNAALPSPAAHNHDVLPLIQQTMCIPKCVPY
jgi:hypothetical protein